MTLHLTEQEREFLIELMEMAHREKLHELHHADSSDYKKLLRHRVTLIESLSAKLAAVEVAP